MIIQVNDKLVTFDISVMHLVFENNKKEIESTQINYIPGKLIISDYAWGKINSDSTKKITLKFNYNTYKKNRQKIGNFQVDLTKTILEQPYVILNIYDFRNRKYKRWYQYLTEKDFLAELRYPNSGIYARQK
jgi:hypothetical protein